MVARAPPSRLAGGAVAVLFRERLAARPARPWQLPVGDLPAVGRERRAAAAQLDDDPVRRGGRDHAGDARRDRAGLVEEVAAVGRKLRQRAVARQLRRRVELTRAERDRLEHAGGVGGVEQPQIPGERRGVVAPLPGEVGDLQRWIRGSARGCSTDRREEGDRQKCRGGERSSHTGYAPTKNRSIAWRKCSRLSATTFVRAAAGCP